MADRYDGWQRPGARARWRAARAFEADWRQRLWVARRLVASRYGDQAPVLLDVDVTGADAGRFYTAEAYHAYWTGHDHAEAPAEAAEDATAPRAPSLGQRALGCLATVAGVALAVAMLTALVVPEVRGTVALSATVGVAATVAVALARRYHGLAWARRAWHRQQRATAARRASAARQARQQANRDQHATVVQERTAQAATARERRRQANRQRHWRERGREPLPSPPDEQDGGEGQIRMGEQGSG